jgi:hypothetical protein
MPNASARPAPADSARLPVFPFVFPHAVYPGDSLLVLAIGSAGDPLAEKLDSSPFLRISSDGVIQQLVLFPPKNEGSIRVDFNGGLGSVSVPFFARPIWTVSPDGSRIATLTTAITGEDGGTYTARVFDSRGAELLSREFPFQGEPIPAHAVDSAISARAPSMRPEMRRVLETEARNRAPPVYPPVVALVIGADQRVWIGLRATEVGNPWLILGDRGDPEAVTVVPRNTSLRVVTATHIWAVERDSLDVESIVRYRVRR